jgi:hypothetical protein
VYEREGVCVYERECVLLYQASTLLTLNEKSHAYSLPTLLITLPTTPPHTIPLTPHHTHTVGQADMMKQVFYRLINIPDDSLDEVEDTEDDEDLFEDDEEKKAGKVHKKKPGIFEYVCVCECVYVCVSVCMCV